MDNKALLIGLSILLLKDGNIKDIVKDNKFRGLIDLDDESMERSIELLSRSKKYVNKEERILLSRAENALELVHKIRKLNNVEEIDEGVDKLEFFRSMDKKDKRDMMIKEMIDILPEGSKRNISKALDIRSKISLLKSLVDLGDGEGLLNSKNIGNMKMLGELFREQKQEEKEEI
ncbi:hypothetical protein [Alkalithermobacter paradoxus]|uniref:Uncharacterized protein n=1 Tax=Alkalithermobacter paradoxus TaxID=29349 RepID=A0A1V4I943_9FIRM|nr:hypothetical protein CLOTH_09170 [[Clostridium] thermoalcaliphilum]